MILFRWVNFVLVWFSIMIINLIPIYFLFPLKWANYCAEVNWSHHCQNEGFNLKQLILPWSCHWNDVTYVRPTFRKYSERKWKMNTGFGFHISSNFSFTLIFFINLGCLNIGNRSNRQWICGLKRLNPVGAAENGSTWRKIFRRAK